MKRHSYSSNGGSPLRVVFAPRERGYEMQMFAEALRRRGHKSLSVNYRANPIYTNNDINLGIVPGEKGPRELGKVLRFAAHAVRNYDVFHFYGGESLLPSNRDLPILRRLGKRIFGHFHGSDLRQKRYVLDVTEPRLLGLAEASKTTLSSPSQQRLLQAWRKYADRIFVSIPELLHIVPEATLIPQPIDLTSLEPSIETASSTPKEILIAHATTDRLVKGTKHVIAAVDELKNAGYPVRLGLIEDVPHDRAMEIYRTSHIAIDEVVQGSYGLFSVELMALGKPVVAYLDPLYQQLRPDLPIVNATPLTLAEKLRMLVEDQMLRIQLGERGREYVERRHATERILDQLIDIYQS